MKESKFVHSGTYTTSETVIVSEERVTKKWNWMGVSIPREGWLNTEEHLEVIAEWSLNRKNWVLLVAFGVDGGNNGFSESFAQVDATPPIGAVLRIRVRATGPPVTRDIYMTADDETPTTKDQIRNAVI
jgi:hypothetical protein